MWERKLNSTSKSIHTDEKLLKLQEMAENFFTEDEIFAFTEHDCFWLADKLNSRGFGEIIYSYDGNLTQEFYRTVGEVWTHMAIEIEDGVFFDVEGVQTAESILKKYSGTEIRKVKDRAHLEKLLEQQELWFEDTCDYSISLKKVEFLLRSSGF